MLTKVAIRNFKRFDEVEVELGNPVLFVGPNDAGKTSALQALMLWDLGLRRWTEKRGGKTAPEKRPGVRECVAAPGSTSEPPSGRMDRAPVRRGVKAAPRILVPKVQVRILAAERRPERVPRSPCPL